MLEIDWKTKAENLWGILDDIDTASDMFKPSDEKSYKAFFDYTMKKCSERGKYMNSLDGQTLTAVEQEVFDYQLKERTRLLKEWEEKVAQQVKSIIEHDTKYMSEEETESYLFKWFHLVQQEIVMWASKNELVTKEEVDNVCQVRGFDIPMKTYITAALSAMYLFGKMILPQPKKEIPDSPNDISEI